MIAALYVQKGGVYYGMPGVDPWDARRDARRYAGTHPVVAHPPCARWSRLARLAETMAVARVERAPLLPGFEHGRSVGKDGGCFAVALDAVLRVGGVLEHPAGSLAWSAFGLTAPAPSGWSPSGAGWVCQVSQKFYGHRANKLTWLFYVGQEEPVALLWGEPKTPWVECADGCGEWWCIEHGEHAFECPCPPIEDWSHSPYDPGRTAGDRRKGSVETMGHDERSRTPILFRDLLLSLARSAVPRG